MVYSTFCVYILDSTQLQLVSTTHLLKSYLLIDFAISIWRNSFTNCQVWQLTATPSGSKCTWLAGPPATPLSPHFLPGYVRAEPGRTGCDLERGTFYPYGEKERFLFNNFAFPELLHVRPGPQGELRDWCSRCFTDQVHFLLPNQQRKRTEIKKANNWQLHGCYLQVVLHFLCFCQFSLPLKLHWLHILNIVQCTVHRCRSTKLS